MASCRSTTVDASLQEAAERILRQSRAPGGAIVASDPRTGRILAWASRGSFDHVTRPFAPSASLFKVVTAAALLDRNAVRLDTPQCFDGGLHDVTESDLRAHRGQRCMPFEKALGHSLNAVIARLAVDRLSPDDLRDTAEALGFGTPVPVDVPAPPNEVTIPSDRLGMARAAAGFWNGTLSPLGALFMMQTIANRGERIRLHLHDALGDERESLGFAMRPGTADALRRMLQVTTTTGTCAAVFRNPDGSRALSGMPIAAKTGTLVGGKPSRMFSWFAGFAPAQKPEIAFAVLLADDVSWWMKANAAGRKFLETYFDR